MKVTASKVGREGDVRARMFNDALVLNRGGLPTASLLTVKVWFEPGVYDMGGT
jgi:hypothetical protein